MEQQLPSQPREVWHDQQLRIFNEQAQAYARNNGVNFTPYDEWPEDISTFLPSLKEKQMAIDLAPESSLPRPKEAMLRHASASQQVVAGLVATRLLAHVLNVPLPQLRVINLGAAGTGKSFINTCVAFIVVKLTGRGRAVLCLAPTGTATTQLFQGRTNASVFGSVSASDGKGDDGGAELSLERRRLLLSLCGDPFNLMAVLQDELFMLEGGALHKCNEGMNEIAGVDADDEALDVDEPLSFFGHVPGATRCHLQPCTPSHPPCSNAVSLLGARSDPCARRHSAAAAGGR